MQTHKHTHVLNPGPRTDLPPKNRPRPPTAGCDAASPTAHVMRLTCPRRYPALPPLGIVAVTIAAAPVITFCAIVVLPPPPPPPIPLPYHAAAIRITSRMLWLVAISLPPPATEDRSPTNCKIGAS